MLKWFRSRAALHHELVETKVLLRLCRQAEAVMQDMHRSEVEAERQHVTAWREGCAALQLQNSILAARLGGIV